jgi:peptide deformylase
MIRPLVILPDPILRRTSARIERIDDAVRQFASDMLDTMRAAEGLGLAAVQVGEPIRMVAIDVGTQDKAPDPRILINPEILDTGTGVSSYEEGCLSIPGFSLDIERPAEVTFRYLGLDGLAHEEVATGMLATCLQHEIDHLEGVLIVDRLSRLKRDMVVKRLLKTGRTT